MYISEGWYSNNVIPLSLPRIPAMLRLMFVLHTVIATTLMGIGVTAVLAAGMVGTQPIAIAAGVGFILAFPASWLIARRVVKLAGTGANT